MSGRKNAIPAYNISEDRSLSAAFNTDSVTMSTSTHIFFTASSSGVSDNTGSFGIEYRIWKDEYHYSDWVALTFIPVPTLADTDAQFVLDARLGPGQARLTYTPSEGSIVNASLIVQDLTYTAVDPGPDGDDITITYTTGGTAGMEVVTVLGTDISIQIDDGVSTATQVKAAFDAESDATDLASVVISGTGSDAQVAASETPLAGGAAPDGTVDVWVTGEQGG